MGHPYLAQEGFALALSALLEFSYVREIAFPWRFPVSMEDQISSRKPCPPVISFTDREISFLSLIRVAPLQVVPSLAILPSWSPSKRYSLTAFFPQRRLTFGYSSHLMVEASVNRVFRHLLRVSLLPVMCGPLSATKGAVAQPIGHSHPPWSPRRYKSCLEPVKSPLRPSYRRVASPSPVSSLAIPTSWS